MDIPIFFVAASRWREPKLKTLPLTIGGTIGVTAGDFYIHRQFSIEDTAKNGIKNNKIDT